MLSGGSTGSAGMVRVPAAARPELLCLPLGSRAVWDLRQGLVQELLLVLLLIPICFKTST